MVPERRVEMKEVLIFDGGWRSEGGAKMVRLPAYLDSQQPKIMVEPKPDIVSPGKSINEQHRTI